MAGTLTAMLTAGGELAAVHKPGGMAIAPSQVTRCLRLAATRVGDVTEKLKGAVAEQARTRIAGRIRRTTVA